MRRHKNFKLFTRSPVKIRRNISFYHDKTEAEFSRDIYEDYDRVVRRQVLLHYGESVTGVYPYTQIERFILNRIPQTEDLKILEIGCGVGNIIGAIALRRPSAVCIGIDYSYQLLRVADDFWREGKSLEIKGERQGWENKSTDGEKCENLTFALAKAENLPLTSDTFDCVVSCFLLDRVENIEATISEMHRVLKPGGKLLLIFPQNYRTAAHWQQFFPFAKLTEYILKTGFTCKNAGEKIQINEPLDAAGNAVLWQCMALEAVKI